MFEFSEDVFEKFKKDTEGKTPEEIEKEAEEMTNKYYEVFLDKLVSIKITKEDCEEIINV